MAIGRGKMFRVFARLRSLPETLMFRFYPQLSQFQLDRATYNARQQMDCHPALRILVDNTILDLAITHESRWITTGAVDWGGQVRHTGYQARVPVYSRKNLTENTAMSLS